MVMGVDETRDHDPVACIYDRNRLVRNWDLRLDGDDFAVFDKHIGLSKITNLIVECQHHAALKKDATCCVDLKKIKIHVCRALRSGC